MSHKTAVIRVFLCIAMFIVVLLMSNDVFAKRISSNEFKELANKCAPEIALETLQAVVKVESGFHPYAIAVVGGSSYYPNDEDSALLIIDEAKNKKQSYSVGLGQINDQNFGLLNVSAKDMLDPCLNLQASAKILKTCFVDAKSTFVDDALSLKAALSCYYSGNFQTGLDHGYVDKVVNHKKTVVPSIDILHRDQQITTPNLVESPHNKHGFMF